ncbi:AI-2E family transporter [Christiangramia fulva]|uniref:AI-2E family transporter n=1 Tax=Christiangramia fulva TaxID=2126553 RepID=A0A2R3Z7S9_9FLAO|nr:AI-2E family transporter [Christiangramia fulva]AVR46347.1 AI-2E family transporter [Christiangramia fulva]
MVSRKKILYTATAATLFIYFLFSGLAHAKGFFAPLFVAVVLSLIMLPASQWMEKGIKRTLAAVFSSLILFFISLGLLFLISLQVKNFTSNWPQLKENLKPKIERIKEFAINNTPLTPERLKKVEKKAGEMISGSGGSGNVSKFIMALLSTLANYLLTFIYVFFLLAYRHIFKDFLINVFPRHKQPKVKQVISKSVHVVPEYLRGKLLLMGILAVLYSIGLGISGVNNYILVSIIAALLTIIPYLGNMIAFSMAVVFGFLTGGTIMTLVGIFLTFSVTQFVESYMLQPYVVGDKVDVHPFFVILVVIIGNILWGIIGMILAVPVMGIITMVLLNIQEVKPLGILLSKEDFSKD